MLASVIVMLAIGDGAKHAVLDRISAMGTNLLVIRPGMPNARGLAIARATGTGASAFAFKGGRRALRHV